MIYFSNPYISLGFSRDPSFEEPELGSAMLLVVAMRVGQEVPAKVFRV